MALSSTRNPPQRATELREPDIRALGWVTEELLRRSFFQIHNKYLVAPARVTLIRNALADNGLGDYSRMDRPSPA